MLSIDQIITSKPEKKQPNSQAGLNVSNSILFGDFKEALGQTASKYNDEQIEKMRITCDKIADLAFDTWLNRRNTA